MDSSSDLSEFAEKDVIEIWVEGGAIEALTEFVGEEFGDQARFDTEVEGLRVLVVESTSVVIHFPGGDYTSCWIRGPVRWKTSVQLAREYAAKRGGKILCDPGLEFPQVHPLSDGFLQIHNGIETIVNVPD